MFRRLEEFAAQIAYEAVCLAVALAFALVILWHAIPKPPLDKERR